MVLLKIPNEVFLMLLTAGLAAVGFALYGEPLNVEQAFVGVRVLGTFFIFLFFSCAVFSWGQLWCRILAFDSRSLTWPAALGSAWTSITAMLLGHLGLIGLGRLLPTLSILFAGTVANAVWSLRNPAAATSPRVQGDVFQRAATAVVGASVGVFVVAAFYPNPFWDPLWYHLLAPRLWSEAGSIGFLKKTVVVMQAVTWEYIFLWGNALLGARDGGGLVAGQLFGQWLHALWGYGGTALALSFFLKRFSNERSWLALAVLSGLCIASFQKMAMLAKNDWGICFWALVGFGILFDEPKLFQKRRMVVAGLFIGLAVAGKLTALFAAGTLLLLWISLDRAWLKKVPCVVLGFLMIVVPVLTWSWRETGNPFFPSMNSVFHSPFLGPSWSRAMQAYQGVGETHKLGEYWSRLKALSSENPLMWLSLLFPFLFVLPARYRPGLKALLPFWATAALAFVAYIVKVGVSLTELRYLGPSLILLSSFPILVIERLLPASFSWVRWPLLLLLALASNITWDSPVAITRTPTATAIVQAHPGGPAFHWLRQNTRRDELVVTLLETRLYYMSDRNMVRLWDNLEMDRAVTGLTTALEAVVALRKFKVRYLFATIEELDKHFDKNVSDLVIAAILAHQSRVVAFAEGAVKIVDLQKLEVALRSSAPR